MSERVDALLEFLRRGFIEPLGRLGGVAAGVVRGFFAAGDRVRRRLVITVLLAVGVYGVYTHPPFASVHRSEVLVRMNVLDGSTSAYVAGTVLVLPGIHQVRRYPTRDQLYRPVEGASATGKAPFQSNEGLSIGVDLAVRWAIDRARIAQLSKQVTLEAGDLIYTGTPSGVGPVLPGDLITAYIDGLPSLTITITEAEK